MSKKRILWNGEFSFLPTGYGVFTQEVLKRLFLRYGDEFELAELSSYGKPIEEDPRPSSLPWKYYPNMPSRHDTKAIDEYNSNPVNQFGKWRWEHTCLDFQPDCVFCYRDPWYDSYVFDSPLRSFYSAVVCPPVDSYPLADNWLDDYQNADSVFSYTDWGRKVLESQGIKVDGLAGPAVDAEIFKPLGDKRQIKESFGIKSDTLIVGTVMRNQMRKLYPALAAAFVEYLKAVPKERADRTLMYWHTAFPDLGWNINNLLKEFGLGNKILFTYTCGNCNSIYPAFCSDARSPCKHCGEYTATFSIANHSISQQNLNVVYNIFDVYVQYSSMEGVGVPLLEAASVGLPMMVPYYAGMCDIVDKLNGIPISINSYYREASTGRYCAIPDNQNLVKKLSEILSLPSSIRASQGYKSRALVQRHFNWDVTTKNLVEVFRKLPKKNWAAPPRLHNANLNIPNNLDNQQFVYWAFHQILGRPDLTNSYLASKMIRDLNWGYSAGNTNFYYVEDSLPGQQANYSPFSRDDAIKVLLGKLEFQNKWELARIERMGL